MTAFELMERISVEELLEWVEYDQCYFDDSWNQHAMLCCLIESLTWKKGSPKPDPEKWRPRVKKRPQDAEKDQLLIDQVKLLRSLNV